MASAPSSPIRLAILDDYQNLSAQQIPSQPNLLTTTFTKTNEPVKDRNDHAALTNALKPFNIICAMRERTVLPRAILTNLPNLRLILTTGLRNAAIDTEACKEAGIIVAGTGFSPSNTSVAPMRDNTAQHTWALILALANNISRDDSTVKSGGWQGDLPLSVNLAGKTFACLGLGRLGTEVAKMAVTAFGMRVQAWSNSLTQEKADAQAQSTGLPPGTFVVAPSKAALFEAADVLSVHYVLSERSHNIVSADELALLRPSAMFVNTSRGPLVDEDALYDVLEKGKILGAALDVFWSEPLPESSRWRSTKWGRDGRSEVVMTPHTGFVSEQTMENWWLQTAENLERWLKGEEVLYRF